MRSAFTAGAASRLLMPASFEALEAGYFRCLLPSAAAGCCRRRHSLLRFASGARFPDDDIAVLR